MSRTAAELQELYRTARKNPRPSYFSTAMVEQQISYEYETYLIQMENTEKRALIARLRKSKDQIEAELDVEALAQQAAEYEISAIGAKKDELALELGDYSSFRTEQLRTKNVPEITQMLGDIGSALGPKLFQRDQAENDVIAAGLVVAEIKSSTGRANKRKQIQAWINIISAYITKG